ncbi:hypothetical protein ABIE09_000937 [Lysobacter enzymogenes]|uniref:single-stranded DNA-binding protein n=1 Tax=Lysobacter enzymogenes TaxID=69 RepID=UPI0033937A86
MTQLNVIIIKSQNSAVRTVPRKDGTKMHFNEQSCAIDCGDEFPRPFKINLDDEQKPYPPGTYYVDPSSFEVNKFGSLEMGRRVKLVPLPPTK